MDKKLIFDLPITIPSEEFFVFLGDKMNQRIVFSGKFGSGKTYFLRKFFEQKQSEYYTLWISPVNYVASSSDDIFELIKFDILFQLLLRDSSLSRIEDIELILSILLALDPNKQLTNLLEKADKTNNDQFILELISNPKPKEVSESALNDFFKSRLNSKGIYERDLISKIIFFLLSKLVSDKELVLVIDDLDRIDPEHIFRILNVFSAHIDIGYASDKQSQVTNKFGFNRIITVCDISNIRRMFHSRYGQNTDFSGYIDKFYSKHIFEFNNLLAVENMVDQVVDHIKGKMESVMSFSSYDKIALIQYTFIRYLILVFHQTRHLSVRNLAKVWEGEIPPYRSAMQIRLVAVM